MSPQVEFAEQAQYYYFNGMFIWGEEGAGGNYKRQSPLSTVLSGLPAAGHDSVNRKINWRDTPISTENKRNTVEEKISSTP